MSIRSHRVLMILLLVGILLAGCASVVTESPLPTAISSIVVRTEISPTVQIPTNEPASPGTAFPSPSTIPATAQPSDTVAPGPASKVAYVGEDGNIWLLDQTSGETLQITTDSAPFEPSSDDGAGYTSYCCPGWSSEGSLLAFRREVGVAVEQGIQSSYQLLVFDISTGGTSTFLEDQEAMNFAWQPGTHQIAYDLTIPTEYFVSSFEENAQGIWVLDVDSRESHELVAPERGYSLLFPKWSRDGRFLSFEEIVAMEGSGMFAFYDLERETYIARDEIIGYYSWSPDGERIAYDRLSYVPSGDERIWIRDRQGGEEQVLSPDFETGYAFHPVFSPLGDSIVYLVETPGQVDGRQHVIVQEIDGGENHDLGEYSQVGDLAWSPDGTRLVFTSGPYNTRKIREITISNEHSNTLASGSQPAVQP